MKIKFFLSDNNMAPTTISDNLFADSLAKEGYLVEKVTDYKRKIEIIKNKDADIIIFQKKILPGHRYDDFKEIKGKIFLCHIDDDYEGMNEQIYRKTLEDTDLILVGTENHAKKLAEDINTPVEVITAISDFDNYPFMDIRYKKNNPLIIAWQQNLADVYVEDLRVVAKPLKEIYEKYNINLRLYGWHEGKHYGIKDNRNIVKEFLPFATFIPFQPLELYFKNIVPDISKADIGIIPYINILNRIGKSGYSLKKMMMLGIPMVVSDFENNRALIEDGVNGFLANSEDEWYKKIELLVRDKDLRENFAINSRKLLEDKFSYEETVNVFIQAIEKYFKLYKF